MRLCDEDQGWLEPDLFNCTSPAFRELNLLVRLPRPDPALRTCTGPWPGLGLLRPVLGPKASCPSRGPPGLFLVAL